MATSDLNHKQREELVAVRNMTLQNLSQTEIAIALDMTLIEIHELQKEAVKHFGTRQPTNRRTIATLEDNILTLAKRIGKNKTEGLPWHEENKECNLLMEELKAMTNNYLIKVR